MIKTERLTKTYGTLNALENCAITIQKGTMTAILGENGSGKSTLLNLIGRLSHPSSGKTYLNDNDIQTFKAIDFAKHVSILKQRNHHNLNLSVYDLVSYGRYPHNPRQLTEEDHQIVRTCLQDIECWDFKDQSIQTLSGGQLQRVYIAMVLAQDTEVILLDEPLNNLDLKHAHEFMQCMNHFVTHRNKTIVMIMHDVNMVYRYCDAVVCLKDGECIAHGTVDSTLTQPILKQLYDLDFTIFTHNTIKQCCVETRNYEL
ncbi:ATP-binding cassette domain-containing protein [Erysipelothrix rhusiopathiae]|nr:ATP-binding cassette domain-containing protein [Erysipelothrix rhusiopathiae]